ncbi:MAG TPA: TonB-dependent siderophore receptor, partial [Steroidobacter sp.]|nr:TonB-dependent siderophore receptor [Steroidobacter sp.]
MNSAHPITLSCGPRSLIAKSVACVTATVLVSAPLAVLGANDSDGENAPTTLPRIRVQADAPEAEDYRVKRTSSATRTNTALRDIPQSVTVVTGEQMADRSVQSIAEAVRYVPGVVMGQGEGNRDQATIRGNNTTADFFVDGVRDDAQHFRDVYNLERLEVLKGPNAMIFGRGGGGGVVNRVSKQADWDQVRAFTIQGGSFNKARTTLDLGGGLTEQLAARVSALYEDSESYRDFVELKRYGVNPTAAIALGDNTLVQVGYEHLRDERTADRGVPSLNGRPLRTDPDTFFGDPKLSRSDAQVNAVSAFVEHETAGGLTIRNRTRFAEYDKFYQNVYAGGPVDPITGVVLIAAYNSANERDNAFNQTDVIWRTELGGLRHTLLAGVELGRQRSDNFRNTGYFDDISTSSPTPASAPTISVPIVFRQSTTDPDNDVKAEVLAVYMQDQIEFSSAWQAVLGLRYDDFSVDLDNHRTGERLTREDGLVSPRLGLIYKPIEPVSLYASYSVSYLPSSGDQFSSLTVTSRTLEPDEFKNHELGLKWDALQNLAITAAAFRLDRSNAVVQGSSSGTTVQTGQQTDGLEIEASGLVAKAWRIAGGYAYQDAEAEGGTVDGATIPITPRHTFSLWNRYDFTARWGLGL